MSTTGRALGVDYGQARVGLAVSDVDGRIASPLATYARRNREADRVYFQELVAREQIARLVVGLPLHLAGHEGEKAAEARAFGQWLTDVTGLPVMFWDERYTTVEAERSLRDARLTHKKRKARRDRVAAQILLQAYLDAEKDLATGV